MFHKTHFPFWILTLSVFCALILPVLIQDGMFMDGVYYSVFSKNLAEGRGTFWYPHFSKTIFPYYSHNPPLTFGIQSIFFKALGSGMYTERVYTFLMACLALIMIVLIWMKLTLHRPDISKMSWLPVFLWVINPGTFWTYRNNMEENTMAFFTLCSCFFIIKTIHGEQFTVYNTALAGIFLFLATLTKGLQGSFLLISFIFYRILNRNFSLKVAFQHSIILFSVLAVIYGTLLTRPEIYDSLKTYFTGRVVNSILNVSTGHNRLYLLYYLFCESIPVLLACMLLLFIFYRRGIRNRLPGPMISNALWILFIGMSASLPLIITLEQRGFYLVTSYSYYALFFAMIVAPGLSELIQRININGLWFARLGKGAVVLFAAVLLFSFSQAGKAGRDADKLHDVYTIGAIVPEGEIVDIPPSIWTDWTLHAYFARYFYISMEQNFGAHTYYLCEKNDSVFPGGYMQVPVNTLRYKLFKKEPK